MQLLTTPLSEVVQKDGSLESFGELLNDIANPTSLATFDPEIFKASLAGTLSFYSPPLIIKPAAASS